MKHSKGFTLIELTMAIMFVSFLVLAVAFVSINVGNMYQKGTTLRAVNQSGRETVDTLRRDIMQADAAIDVVDQGDVIRWCLGNVTYIANRAQLIAQEDPTLTVNSASGEPYRLVRVSDPAKALCAAPYPDPTPVAGSLPVDLLGSSVPALAVYEMELNQLATSSHQTLYEMSLLMGTVEYTGGAMIVDSDNRCLPHTDPAANANYCSVVEFKTIIRSGGTS